MVLVPSTLSINVPADMNFLYELRIHHGSLRVGYVKKLRLCVTLIMGYPDYEIWVMTYRAISITSSYEFSMWKLMFLHDRESLPVVANQVIDTGIELHILTILSYWQVWLAVLVQMSGYCMISSILCSMVSSFKVRRSKIQRRWLTTRASGVPSHCTSTLEFPENIDHRLHKEDNQITQVCLGHYMTWTNVRFLTVLRKFMLKIPSSGNIMVVIFPVKSAVAIPNCRNSLIFLTWLMEGVLYPFSARVDQRCVTSSLSVLGQECFQSYGLLSTRDYVWLFYVLMTSPYEMGKLSDKRGSFDECCLKTGYFTTITTICVAYRR